MKDVNTTGERVSQLRLEMEKKRDEWRRVRDDRLGLKEKLLSLGMDKREICRDKKYRALKKEQEHYTRILRHIEKQLNKELSGKSSM